MSITQLETEEILQELGWHRSSGELYTIFERGPVETVLRGEIYICRSSILAHIFDPEDKTVQKWKIGDAYTDSIVRIAGWMEPYFTIKTTNILALREIQTMYTFSVAGRK